MIEYYPPASPAEWIETICAAITVLVGLILLLAPRPILRFSTNDFNEVEVAAVFILRGHLAGLLVGLGLAAILLQQPLIYLALAVSWGFSAIGQLVSLVVDRHLSASKVFVLILKSAIAVFAALPVFGIFG